MTTTFVITTIALFIGLALAIGKYEYTKSLEKAEGS